MSLELTNIRKSYREPGGSRLDVLDIPHFAMKQGEQVVLVGSSGGGKTTLLNIISGISRADSGSVVIDGIDIGILPEAGRDRFRAERIGFVFQTFNLLPAFTALENVLLGMSFSGKRGDRTRARELLTRMGLENRLRHRPGQLSVGEQQRVAVARALANKPSLLLADEPTANVDTGNQANVLNFIREACEENNVSLLMVTHTPDVAAQFDRVETLADFNKVGVRS
jgi:putative ABC transport system ATP-binding protein